jgi:predicted GNAT family acetyltransferase
MLGTKTQVRSLRPGDLPELVALLDADPHVNVFVRARVDSTGLREGWGGVYVAGYFEDGRLVSACHEGSNVVLVEPTPAAVEAFSERLLERRMRPASIVGLRDSVSMMWKYLAPTMGPARSERLDQPFMVTTRDSTIEPDPRVRRVMIDEFDTVYPACVAMFTEEVGVNPEVGNRHGYRARVAQLITHGWSFAIIEDDHVLFKTEVGAVAGDVCQLQGVWVHPDARGQGIAAPAMAAVVNQVRRSVAPHVTLYVNEHNVAARRTYLRAGFAQTATLASILL